MTERTLRPVTPLGLLVEHLDEVAALVEHADNAEGPGELAAELDGVRQRVREARLLAAGLDPYLELSTSPESADLADLAQETLGYRYPERRGGPGGSAVTGALEPEMLSGHVEGQFLQLLVHATRARRVLEVGMFTGYSALAMAEALPDDGVVTACEIDDDVANFAQQRFATATHGAKIDVEVGPASDTLARLAAQGSPYDLVFIDADKAGYAGYLDAVLDGGLLSPHGLVCVDNTLMQGGAYGAGPDSDNSRAIADFNAKVADDDRLQQVLVPLRDGITLIRRRADPLADRQEVSP